MELQDHHDAINRITKQIENNRKYLLGDCEEKRKIAAELNGLLAQLAEDHWAAIRLERNIVGVRVAA